MSDKQFIYNSLQDVYTAAVEGIASQRWQRAMDAETDRCVYRDVNGQNVRKCAIGWCIPDSVYDSELEGTNGADIMHNDRVYDAGVFNVDAISDAAIDEMQVAHDGGYSETDMICRLHGFGTRFGLTIPQVLEDAYTALSANEQ